MNDSPPVGSVERDAALAAQMKASTATTLPDGIVLNIPDNALRIWNAGLDEMPIPPRGWLLGNAFCRGFVSSLIADGGTGKSALRLLQALSVATGRSLTGEHVFQRSRVLYLGFEDGESETRRRIRAAMIRHNIEPMDLKSWFFASCPNADNGKLMDKDERGAPIIGLLADELRIEIKRLGIALLILDPFIKTHAVEENDNSAIDKVMQVLSDLATELNVAVDLPHHTSKGPADPGNANRGRGASGMKDAARLVYTLSPMSPEEAQLFGLQEADRRRLIRLDSGKVNVAPPLDSAKWFRLVGVPLGNGNELYPHGDEVQTVEVWTPPDTWAGMSHHLLNEILTEIDKGLPDRNRYSDGPNVTDRAAWKVVMVHASDRTEKQARDIIKTWVKNGVLTVIEYENPVTRKTVKGLQVNDAKRPS